MLYLLVKEHLVTGLKYLCKHKSSKEETCYTYKGSGTYWKRHLKIHGNNLKTTCIFKTLDKEKFKKVSTEYSHYFNIINSKDWANLTIEQGQGGTTNSPDFYSKMAKKLWNNPELKEKLLKRLKETSQPNAVISSKEKRLGKPLTEEHKNKLRGERHHVDYCKNKHSRSIITPFGKFGSIREAFRNITGYSYRMIWTRVQQNNEWRYV